MRRYGVVDARRCPYRGGRHVSDYIDWLDFGIYYSPTMMTSIVLMNCTYT
jgi:hypothetical protein